MSLLELDSLSVAQAVRARVSKLLPGRVITRLNEPSSFGSTGMSRFTKFVAKRPNVAANAEAFDELWERGYLPIASGWPDFLVVEDKDTIFVVEVKGPGDSLRPNQTVVLDALARAGIDTYIRWPEGYEAVGNSTPWEER